jgi:putative ATP-binding cassette transporter
MTYTADAAVHPVLSETSGAPTPLLRFWQTVKGYWSPQGDRAAWPVTLSLLGVVLLSLAVTYSINLWNRHFFDALEAKNAPAAIDQAVLFPGLVGVYLIVCVFGMWARMTAQRTCVARLVQRSFAVPMVGKKSLLQA